MSLRVLITGGRSYSNWHRVFRALDQLHTAHGIAVVIQGGATGADGLAREWATERRIAQVTVPADWASYGPKAGPIRNSAMLRERPDVVVAFPGGKGTADLIDKASRSVVPILHGEHDCSWKDRPAARGAEARP